MKGSVLDSGYLLILMFVFGILFMVVAYVSSNVANTGNATIDTYTYYGNQGMLALNTVAPLMVLGIGIALIISAAFIRSNPAFFFFFMIINGVMAYVTMNLSNAWQAAFTNNALSATASNFPAWGVVMQYFPFISIILGIIFAIAVYAKGGE